MSETVAVVGGTGFLGSHIVRKLLEAGHTPVVVARYPEKLLKARPAVDAEVRTGDVTVLDTLRSAFAGCTAVHSTAAVVGQIFTAPSRDQEETAIETNAQGVLNVLQAAQELGVRRAIFTGTCSTRYCADGRMATEDTPPTPPKLANDAYVRSKLKAEAAVDELCRKISVEVVTILPGALIGPGDVFGTPLNGTVLDQLNGKAMPSSILGGIPLVDVRDVAQAHVAAQQIERPHSSYLAVAATVSSREWRDLVDRLTGTKGPRLFLSPRMAMTLAMVLEFAARLTRTAPILTRNMVRHVAIGQRYDCSRAQRELGINFAPAETAVRDMVRWYVDNGFVTHPERLVLR